MGGCRQAGPGVKLGAGFWQLLGSFPAASRQPFASFLAACQNLQIQQRQLPGSFLATSGCWWRGKSRWMASSGGVVGSSLLVEGSCLLVNSQEAVASWFPPLLGCYAMCMSFHRLMGKDVVFTRQGCHSNSTMPAACCCPASLARKHDVIGSGGEGGRAMEGGVSSIQQTLEAMIADRLQGAHRGIMHDVEPMQCCCCRCRLLHPLQHVAVPILVTTPLLKCADCIPILALLAFVCQRRGIVVLRPKAAFKSCQTVNWSAAA